MNCELEHKIFDVTPGGFEALALEVFRFQYSYNQVYQQFVRALGMSVDQVATISSIPFMPIQFFKTREIITGDFVPEIVFESSGTTNTGNSRHLVKSMALYKKSFLKAFHLFYGPPETWRIIGLLPSYLERQHSSLVAMVHELVNKSGNSESGFYLYEMDQLSETLKTNRPGGRTLLIGVSFALLDLADRHQFPLTATVVMETGGMKGRRKELTREEVHEQMKSAWGIEAVHSEYGMTELLSQAYSKGNGLFRCPPWMRVLLREEDDPLAPIKTSGGNKGFSNGVVNVIDLANLYSCSFIATDDVGRLYPDGSFEIMGRMDTADMRGCNLMYVGG